MLGLLSELGSLGNPNYIELYFERLLPQFTLNKDLWHLYVSNIDKICKTPEQKYLLYQRALKNLYQDHVLWCKYALEMEKQKVSFHYIVNLLDT